MSYQVLARKWRPGNFDELVGQQQTSQALINALESQRLHHAYLFTGTRGVGKTTIARILSKSLNCDLGITSKPCGECASCVEITQGNFVDLLEIDAASKTKVEDTRELLDNVQYRPTRGRYKVYLIDEVHMLSGHSFNALLKTLEEPPPHVIFLLATTDPQKLPVTVLSRCLQFNLRRMQENEIISHLGKILEAENIHFESEALLPIAKGADGSMRDALSLLDQAIAYSGEQILKSTVLEMLGSIDRSYAFELLEAINQNDAALLIQAIEKISQYSPDYSELMADWLSLLHQIAVEQVVNASTDEKICHFAGQISPADLQLYYQLSLQARRDLAYAPHPQQGFAMAMLRILTFKPQISISPSSPDKKKLENTPLEPVIAERQQNASPQSVQAGQQTPVANQPTASVAKLRQSVEPEIEQAHLVNEPQPDRPVLQIVVNNQNELTSDSNVVDLVATEMDESSSNNGSAEPVKELPCEQKKPIALTELSKDNWFQVVESVNIEGNGLQILLNSIAEVQINGLIINYLETVETLLTAQARKRVTEELRHYFKQVSIEIKFNPVSSVASETPKERQNRLHQIAIKKAHDKLLADPQISYLIENIGASLAVESIQLKN